MMKTSRGMNANSNRRSKRFSTNSRESDDRHSSGGENRYGRSKRRSMMVSNRYW